MMEKDITAILDCLSISDRSQILDLPYVKKEHLPDVKKERLVGLSKSKINFRKIY